MSSKPKPLGKHRPEILFGILVFLSGVAALTHQLLWTRRLIDLLGASGESTARVFGTFFLGLSIGSAVAALLIGRIRNPLKWAGLVQLCIPLLVIPVINLSAMTDWIWPNLGGESILGLNGYAIKSLLSLGFVFPPSAMMGLSFPLIVAGVLRLDRAALGCTGINLYAINTLGGAFGVLFTVMVALPQLGNFASMVLAAAVDGIVGVALLAYAHGCNFPSPGPIQTAKSRESSTMMVKPFRAAIGLALFSGMAVLALEVAAFQMFQLAATISLFSPAVVLFCVISCLGIAAAIFSRCESFFISQTKEKTIVLVLLVSGILVVLSPQIFMGIAQRSNWFAENTGVSHFVFKLGALALLSVGPAYLVAGLIFPFAIAFAGQHCSAAQSGRRLGLLLAVNGLGGLLGAELTYRVLLPSLGVYAAISVIGLGFAVVAFVIALVPIWSSVQNRMGRVMASVAVCIVLAICLVNSFLPVVNPPPGIKPIDIRSGREGTVAVLEDRRGDRSILVANQYMLGGTSVRYDQERQVLLPIVLHQQPVKVACIGLATGITPGAALSIPSVEEVTSIEISPLVAKAAATYFSDYNHNICQDEAASVVIGDGRTYIASMADKFDVITGDLFLPWEPGTARLYSREHFESVRQALKPGGLFCQWLPMYQLTSDQFRQIADTFESEFGETHLFINHFRVASPMLALVGGKEGGCLDWGLVARRCADLRESNALRDPVLRHESGIRLLHLGQWRREQAGTQLVSLADPSLEYAAATVRLSADPGMKYFNPANWVRFCRSRQQDVSAGDLNSKLSAQTNLMMLATGLMELDYAHRTRHKLADSIASRVSQSIPHCIVDDRLADWKRWPGASVVEDIENEKPTLELVN